MRPQQQNRRMRGRNNNNNSNNNNNRKGPNPLTRNYESNGPDVKIRGSAQQIAEKYAQLARDAQSSGDRVMAENYLQHAEHYNRIIAAAQAQMPIQQNQPQNRDDFDDDDEDRDDFDGNAGGPADVQQPAVNHGAGPQPVIEGTPAEVALNTENGRDNGGNRHFRDRRHGGYQNGQNNGQRSEQNRNDQGRNDQYSRREEAQPEAVVPVVAEGVVQPDLGPAALAAQAERMENGADDGAGRRPRRPRRSRRPDQGGEATETGGGEGGEAAASEASASDSGSDAGLIPVES